MDHYAIDQFLHLADSLHFGKTSEACNISPSALSRSIQRLEEELGHKLFERDNRSVQLTSAGCIFKDYAIEFWANWYILKDRLATGSESLSGTVSVYCSVTASYTFLPTIIEKFRNTYPAIHLHLETGVAENAIERISNGEVDIVVAAKPEHPIGGLGFSGIATTPLVFIDAQNRGNRNGHTTIDSTTPLLLPDHGLARKRVDVWLRSKKIKPHIYAEVAGNEAIIAMVHLGCGIGVVPSIVLENSPVRNAIRIVDTNPALKPYEVGVCVSKRRLQSPLVNAFWRCARSHYV